MLLEIEEGMRLGINVTRDDPVSNRSSVGDVEAAHNREGVAQA